MVLPICRRAPACNAERPACPPLSPPARRRTWRPRPARARPPWPAPRSPAAARRPSRRTAASSAATGTGPKRAGGGGAASKAWQCGPVSPLSSFGFWSKTALSALTPAAPPRRRDLPAEVRPVLEDNKMLTEELRRYRQRAGQQEGLLLAHERTIAALQVELAAARQSLRECSVQPAQLLEAREFRKQLAERCAPRCREVGARGEPGPCLEDSRSWLNCPLSSAPSQLHVNAGTPASGSCSSGAACWRGPRRRRSGGWGTTWRPSGASRRSSSSR